MSHVATPPSHHKTITYTEKREATNCFFMLAVELTAQTTTVEYWYWPDVFPVEITQQVDLVNPDRVVVGVVAVRHPVVWQDHNVNKLLHPGLIKPTFQMNQGGIQLKQNINSFVPISWVRYYGGGGRGGQICIILENISDVSSESCSVYHVRSGLVSVPPV